MNRRAIAELSLGHFLIDLCQGVVPALAPFLVEGRGFSRTEAAGLVFAISATSSFVQPIFGQLADRLAMAWLLPASILLTGSALALGAQAPSYVLVLAAFGLSGLGVAAFHPEAARKANLASGERRTTGMSFFSIGGGLGFALAPAVTLTLVEPLGTLGLLALLVPTGIISGLLSGRFGASPTSSHSSKTGRPSIDGVDDWRAFWILSVATVSRSIVFYGINTFLALYFMSRWKLSAAEASWAPDHLPGNQHFGDAAGGMAGRPVRTTDGHPGRVRGRHGVLDALLAGPGSSRRDGPPGASGRFHLHADQRTRRARAGVPAEPGRYGLRGDTRTGCECRRHVCASPGLRG